MPAFCGSSSRAAHVQHRSRRVDACGGSSYDHVVPGSRWNGSERCLHSFIRTHGAHRGTDRTSGAQGAIMPLTRIGSYPHSTRWIFCVACLAHAAWKKGFQSAENLILLSFPNFLQTHCNLFSQLNGNEKQVASKFAFKRTKQLM